MRHVHQSAVQAKEDQPWPNTAKNGAPHLDCDIDSGRSSRMQINKASC